MSKSDAVSDVHLEPRRPLTPAQELIWTSQRLQPESPHQNMALLTRFGDAIDPQRFLRAVDEVVARSDALRTVVRELDGTPHPAVMAEPPSPCQHTAMSAAEVDAWIADRVAVPVDLERAAYESVLLEFDDGTWAWFVNVHHIVIDAASSANFFRAVAARYQGEDYVIPDYVQTWSELSAAHAPERVQKAADRWAMHPAAAPTELYRPDTGETTAADRVRIDMASGRQHALDALLADRFRLLSPDLSTTVALATALAAYLARLGNPRVTIGIPVHHRSTPAAKAVIGPLVELFPLTVDVADDDTFASLHNNVARTFMQLLSSALPGTSPRQSFDVVLNVHAATLGDFGPVPAVTRWIHPGHIDSHHRMRVQALDYDGSGTLELALDVNHRTAAADHRQRAAGHLARVLDAMLADADMAVHTVGLVGDDEALLMQSFTRPNPGVPLDGFAPSIVGEQLRANGTVPTIHASIDGGQMTLTAAEVERRIDEVARKLRRAGYGNGDLVGIEMGVSVDAVIAIHGVLRAGAAFVPIDPAYPDGRRTHIRTDSAAALVLTSLADLDALAVVEPNPLPVVLEPDDLAYVIYTSGSTGLPKGVPITHRGLCEYLGFAYNTYVGGIERKTRAARLAGDLGRESRAQLTMPLFTSLSFDLTITTLFLPFLAGGLMTIHPAGGLPALREIADQQRATLVKATPSHLELLVRMIDDDHPLTGLIVGGEAFMTDLADRLIDTTGNDLLIWNEYGPTEAVVGCMEHLYDQHRDPGPEVPIGRPAPGVGLHILDSSGRPVPLGVPGELYISRPGMTRGYLGRTNLNRDKLVVVPQSGTKETLYRTGDLVRMLDADRMVYLGRIDEQIKVGGIRLEPGEIEHVALGVPGVERAVAGLWTPDANQQLEHCVRCGLGSDVPDVVIDGDGVCSSCHAYDVVAPQADAWFKTEGDLALALAQARERSTGDYDVIHLISGGKDSTYALYKLVEMGARVFAITLDNGYIAEVAKANVRRATSALGVDHEFVTVEGMDEIFKDSLERFSNVCQGCYKAIYTIALAKAEELGVPAIVTGLSRGQFFETRLVPGMFESDRFDPEAIDAMVREARHVYHTTPDAVSEHMDVDFLADEAIFDRISFIDFYRYVDVPLSELYEALEGSGTWQRPPDSGRSTNCLINAAGIFVHKMEQGHHNYAAPYSWDVRLGHKTRDEAMYELDDPMDDEELAAITTMLAEVGYEPRKPEVLTLWVEAASDLDIDAVESALAAGLPSHSVPHAIEIVPEMPITTNGKVDKASLPAPAFRRRAAGAGQGRALSTDTEHEVAAIWTTVLGVSDLHAKDDFFALGGTSLHALEMIVRVSERFDVVIAESTAFTKRSIEALSSHIDAALLEDDRASAAGALTVPELPGDERPLSGGEESMLYEWRRDPTDTRYNVARLYLVPDDIDIERFNAAVSAVVAHQPTLHTSYGLTRRPLSTSAALRIGQAHAQTATLEHLADRLNESTFDLVNGPIVTVHHLTANDENAANQRAILLRTHHIVSDAGSLDVMWDQIDRAYRGVELPALKTSYAAHGVWQRTRMSNPQDVWNPIDETAELVVRNRRVEPDGYVHQESDLTMSELRSAAGTTPFSSALAALAAVMRGYHDGDSIEISVTSSVRDHPALADVVGYFLNPLPLLIDTAFDTSMHELAESVSTTLAEALEHRAVPFGSIIRSARDRGIAGPTGRVMLAVEDLADAELDGQAVEHTILSSGTAVNDLTFFVQIRGERLELGCEYRGGTVGRELATRLLDRFEIALETLVFEAHETVGSCIDRPAPLAGAPLGLALVDHTPDRIARHIRSTPDALAVRSGDETLTYAEVDERARAIAARLRAVGVGHGDRVAIVLARSVDLVPAIWSCWLLGASYVPIDATQPAARITALISAADVSAALSSGNGHPGLSEVITVRTDATDAAVLPVNRRKVVVDTDEAYVIFTSGSTGEPKGVSISHGNLTASNTARLDWYRFDGRNGAVERFLLVSSAGFDSSIVGLFWTLGSGGEIIIPTESEVHDVDALLSLVAQHRISHLLMVPTLYSAMLQRDSGELRALHTAIVAGEACPPALVGRHFAALPEVELINEYGPTEATVWSTAHRCVPMDAERSVIPIGGPIPGMTLEVLGVDGSAAPLDVAGELVVSGPGVSSGYLSGVDEAAFTMRSAGRSYFTGDLVVRRADASVDFLGRVDNQLSVGGVRLEPAEIEQAITSIAGVDACLVDERDGGLYAWVESSIPGREVREATARLVPTTHLPRQVFVAGLPRNANGKLDRTRIDLLEVESQDASALGVALGAEDPLVATVISMFSAVFDGAAIAATSDFFDVGGDSLRAVALVSHLENELGQRVAIGELIDAPTPVALAAKLRASAPVDTLSNPQGCRRDQSSTDMVAPPTPAAHGPQPTEGSRPGVPSASLVEWLRSSGTGTPLIVLPPGGGNLLRYAPLVRALDEETPVVGVRLPGADGRSDIVNTIGRQAAVMVDALDEAGVEGPYRLLGWSTGGLLAWEIAQSLLARGDHLEMVTMVDTVMAGVRVDDADSAAGKYRKLLSDGGVSAVFGEGAKRLRERTTFALARRRYAQARELGAVPSAEDAERQLGPVIRRAALAYQPDVLDAPVLYVAASESDDAVTVDPWAELQFGTGNFLAVEIEGCHFLPEDRCIIGPNGAPELVAFMQRFLDR